MKIKFSHKYDKLLGNAGYITKATLLDIFIVNLEELSQPFIDYDTDNGKYELPKRGKYMVLLFKKPYMMHHLFTTVRRWTPDKYKYYQGMIGKEVNIEYKD